MMRFITAVLAAAIGITAAGAQYLNLPDASSDRFTVPADRVWPSTHGEADVCLWNGDKIAAVSMAIDDNSLPDIPWWMEMGDKYGFRFTWFVIVWPYMYDYDGSAGTNQGYFGTAATFKAVFDRGHDVQGHGTGSINSLSDSLYEKDLLFTKRVLEDSIPGNRCIAYAYPSGVATKSYVAARHYIGARGTSGGVDPAARVRVMNTRDGGVSESSVASLLTPGSSSYRGWINDLVHLITTQTDSVDKLAQLEAKEKQLKVLDRNRDDLWVAPFREVISYNQSYATHTLNVTSATASEIRFTLTDSMVDSMFTFPLTVKLRLDADWDDMTVLQGGSAAPFSIILHEGNKYAMVQAVPDGGEVVMTRTAPTVCAVPVITPDQGTFRDGVAVTMTCITSGAEIRYTTDGSTPDGSSSLYSGPVTLAASATVKAVAVKSGLVTSAVDSAVLVVNVDTTPPALSVVTAVGNPNRVVVGFSEGVDAASAGTATNYSIPGLVVSGAGLQADGRTVVLTTTGMTAGTGYTLTVADVTDSSGNPADGSKAFTMLDAPADSGLTGYWSFDDGDAVAPDYSGNGNTGIIHGATAVPGTSGMALHFDGEDDYVNIGPSDFGMAATNEFTIAFWFKAQNGWTGSLADSRNYIRPYVIGLYYAGRKLDISIRSSSTAGFTSTATFATDTWYHAALTYTDGEQVLYVDGAADVVKTQTGALSTSTSTDDYLGAGFEGMIDEMRIYNRALPAAEVAALASRAPVPVDTTVTAAPVIMPAGGTFADRVKVTMTSATAGAEIRYTTDGSDPGAGSDLYADSLVLTASATVKARAFKAGRDSSDVTTADFTVTTDVTAPSLANVMAADVPTQVTVVFSEAVAAADAEDETNYTIPGLTVSAATLGADLKTVTLTVSAMTADREYTLAVATITDRAVSPNTATSLQRSYTYTESGSTALPGVVSYWSMNTMIDSTVADDEGTNDGTATAGVTWTPDGYAGGALSFDGSGYLDVGTSDFGADASDAITVCAWFKADALAGNFFAKGQYVNPVSLHINSGKVRAIVRASGTNYVTTSTPLSTGTWYHAALTVAGSTAVLYVNGAQEKQQNVGAALANGSGYYTRIGDGFDGIVDEVQVYDRALSAAEILSIYENAPMRAVATPVISPAAGTFTDTVRVSISCTDAGAALYYTTDGTDPDSVTGTLYTAPFTLSASADVKVIGYLDGYLASATASAAFTKTSGIAGPYVPAGFRTGGASTYFDMNGRPVDGASVGRGIIIRVDENGVRKELRY